MNNLVYLNGSFLPLEKAYISPDDRGFYFADGVYEVIKFYKGKAFCYPEHMNRLKRSLGEVRIDFHGIRELEAICNELIRLNHFEYLYAGVYIQITRGTGRRMHGFPDGQTKPTIYINAFPLPPRIEKMTKGIGVILREDIRWHRCDIKSIALLPNVLMYQEALDKGAGECFFIRNGNFTEATHSNIFGIKNGELYTHPDSNLLLPGITKIVVFQICREKGIPFRETAIGAGDSRTFDEFFMAGTGNEIMPVIQLEDHIVGKGEPGPITRQIQGGFFRKTYGEMADDWDFRNWW
jgi:D-alanine transaminase